MTAQDLAELIRDAQVGLRWETIPQTAKRYNVSVVKVRDLLGMMAERGYRVTARHDAHWRVDVTGFDRAYRQMFERPFVQPL